MSDLRKVILIYGPHRSGTSAFAGTLQDVGLSFSKDLLQPSEYNQKGYFEDEEIVTFNDQLLAHLGGSWHEPISIWNDSSLDELATYLEPARAMINERLASTDFICIKDPRFSLLMPFWKEVIGVLSNTELYCLILFRHPLDTSLSLVKRNNFSLEKASNVTLRYYLSAELGSRGTQRKLIIFEDFVRNPKAVLSEIEGLISIPLKGESEFVDANLLSQNEDSKSQPNLPLTRALALYDSLKSEETVHEKLWNKIWEESIGDPRDIKPNAKSISSEVVTKGIWMMLKSPLRAIRHFNPTNIKILLNALKEENSQTILKNLKKLLSK